MQAIADRLAAYPDSLRPIKEAAGRYLKYPSVVTDDGVIQIGHRPWIGELSYIVMLWPGIDKEALDLYSRTFEIKIPEMYVSFLQQMNGAIPFGMSLCGVPLSMLGDPPLLDRTVVQCHDLATAAKDWITEYRVAARLFHFGFRYFSETENVGYFIDQGKRIKCIKESGKVVGEWTDFTEFLSDELPVSEKLEEELFPSEWAT